MDERGGPRRKQIVGWSEYVDFPDWGIKRVRAKVDTGARTSALHVEDMEELAGNRLRFYVRPRRNSRGRRVAVIARIHKRAKVRSSTGHYSMRYFVKTQVQIGPVGKKIEISLVSRERMLFRMLLGRKALERDFLVDVTRRSKLTGKPKKKVAEP